MKSYDFFLFALKAAFTINGGAAIALIALLGTLIKEHSVLSTIASPASWALHAFWVGVGAATAAGFSTFAYLRDGRVGFWQSDCWSCRLSALAPAYH